MLHSKCIFENLQFCLQAYQYYFGSGENAALGKCGPGGGLEILTENVASGRSRKDLGVGLGGVSGGSRGGHRGVTRGSQGGHAGVTGGSRA